MSHTDHVGATTILPDGTTVITQPGAQGGAVPGAMPGAVPNTSFASEFEKYYAMKNKSKLSEKCNASISSPTFFIVFPLGLQCYSENYFINGMTPS